MEYLRVSSDSNSFANQLRSSSYVDPPSFSIQLTADTHQPESVPRSVSDDGRRPDGRTLFWNAPGNALRMAAVWCELNSETRGIDVTRQAESIAEGIRL